MTEEKIINAGKKENQPQDKTDKEHLNDEQLDKVAGGLGESIYLKETLPDDTTYETMGK